MLIRQGGYFLKSFLKMIDFKWHMEEKVWKKEITEENNVASIHKDLAEIAEEWGFQLREGRGHAE